MCGIAVLFEPTAPAWLPEVAHGMTRLARHRGPDSEGLVLFNAADASPTVVCTDETPSDVVRTEAGRGTAGVRASLALGHRRLSIIDLSSAGHQPMGDDARASWITFNGEIYNFAELRGELEALGHHFRSGTDTEVILAAYRAWGPSCLRRFNGMFAFAIFDCRTRRLFAARDHFGIKPLYWWRTPSGGVAFASEIKQFSAHPQWRAALNGQLAYEFLHLGLLDHTRGTLFSGVEQLRGGECLDMSLDEIARQGPAPVRWYELHGTPFSGSLDDAGARFRDLLQDSVRLRLRADVPVGSCLSGGLDSSAIVCLIRRLHGDQPHHRQKTFSAYSDCARFDERAFAQEVIRTTGADSHFVVPDPDVLLRTLHELTWTQDEPFGSSSIFAQWVVFELARRSGVIVMLDGQGADEMLCGYRSFLAPRIAGLFARGQWAQLAHESIDLRKLHGWSLSQQARAIASELLPAAADRLRPAARQGRTFPAYLDQGRLAAVPSTPFRRRVEARNLVGAFSRSQITALNLPMLLHWEDRNSMAHGLEARLPFLDYRLVEFCLGLPEDYKLKDGWTKRVLRHGLRDILPEAVRTRRSKLGFSTAEEVWMTDTHRASFHRLVEQAVAAAGGLLRPAALTRATQMINGTVPFDAFAWRCISFGLWIERFGVAATRL